MYSSGSDKLSKVQLYISTSCQPGSRVIRAVSDVEKLFILFSNLAVKAKSENKKKVFFSTSKKARIN